MQPKFKPGERITVSDVEYIERYGGFLPLVGWVDHTEEIKNGNQHMGWWIYIRPDDPKQPITRWEQDKVSRVEVKLYGRLLRNQPAISCPWCLEHGRDPRLAPYVIHPDIPDCQCWHHHHEEHMPDCPLGN